MARNLVFWFAAFLLAVFIGFWPTYTARLAEGITWHVQAHGALLLAWCLLLVTQAGLIRGRRGDVHRILGQVSFLLVPLIVVSSVAVEHGSLVRTGGKLDEEALFFAYLVIALLAVFVLAFALAIRHRRTMALHMRYMACTSLAMFDPVFARILDVRFGIPFPVQQMITFAMIDAILLWLCYRDRDKPYRAFHVMLAAFVAVQIPTFFVYRTAWWREVVAWFAGLPIS